MKQLKDGGLAFYRDGSRTIKQGMKKLLPVLACFIVVALLAAPFKWEVSSFLLECVLLYGCIIILASGIGILCFKFRRPSCTIYDQYITWEDTQDSAIGKKRKLFFKDLGGFFIKTETVYFGKYLFKEKVICFSSKDPQVEVPFFPHYAWLSEQDQQLLLTLLHEKGLAQLPEPKLENLK